MPAASSDLALALHGVLAVLVEFAGGAIERQARCPRPACSPPLRSTCMMKPSASSADLRLGAKPPSSPTLVLWPASLSALRRVWKISAPMRMASATGGRAHRHDHEFLDVDGVVGMRAAVDDVHHRHGQQVRRWRRRDSGRAAGPRPRPRPWPRPARRRGWRWRRAGPCWACRRASFRHRRCGAGPRRPCRDSASKISPLTASTALQHALAEVALRVAVAQLDGLMRAGRGAGGHRRATQRAVLQRRHRPRRSGLPRLSKISRPIMSTMAVMAFSQLERVCGRGPACERLLGGF